MYFMYIQKIVYTKKDRKYVKKAHINLSYLNGIMKKSFELTLSKQFYIESMRGFKNGFTGFQKQNQKEYKTTNQRTAASILGGRLLYDHHSFGYIG